MDPSEFEDTIERSSEALDAGALETFLNGPTEAQETFAPFDIAKEAGDLYLAIYNLQQYLTKFAKVGSEEFMVGLDERALKIAEFKEDYLLRRKKLTAAVKKHMQELQQLDSEGGEGEIAEALAAVKEKSLLMVDVFKTEYDQLSTFAKFSEASFVLTYKDIRDFIPESNTLLEQALAACLSTQEIFKRAQEQFRIADHLLSAINNVSSHNNSNQTSSHHHIDPIMSFSNLSDLDRQLQKQHEEFDRETETLKQQHLTELHDLRTRYEKEYRNQELTLQQNYEQRFLQLQQRCDESILRKDNEIASLLHQVDTLQTQSMQWDERSKTLDAEYHRRQQLEEKLQQALLDLSEANITTTKTQQTLDQSREDFNDLLLQMKTEAQNAVKQQNKAQEQIDELQRRLNQQEQQALENPPRDLQPLLDRIGYTSASFSADNHGGSEKRPSVPWTSIEAFIIERIRRLDSENISLRLAEQDRNVILKALQEQYDELAPRLVDRNQVIAALEKDLLAAQEAIRQRNKSQPSGVSSNSAMTPSIQSAAGLSQAQAVRLVTDSIDIADIETTIDPANADPSANDKVNLQQAIVNQRDRYMKNCRELEQQIVVIKQQEIALQSNVQRLTQENLELYERLRTLRTDMRSRKTASSLVDHEEHMGDDGLELGKGGLGSGSGSNTSAGGTGSDSLDRRYSQLFQQQFLNKLIPGDRWIASVLRYILQDQYTRMAFMLYIIIIHLCALVYVFQVLTPQWEEEIDAQQKAKWSLSTLSLPEHPDVE